MANERFMVTGALGCIGAWVVRNLVEEGCPVWSFDLASDPHRLKLVMSGEQFEQVHLLKGDLTDFDQVLAAMQENGIQQVIHLGALQVPFCKANPVLGAQVNVVGTVNVLEAARQLGLPRVVYASSIAVYGASEEYEQGPIPSDAPLHPHTLYGVYKQADEGAARVYSQDWGLSSIGLRPYTLYGPGRDQGMTSSPTKAMLAAAAGQPFHIPYGGRGCFQYVDDVAKIFIRACRVPFEGAQVFNLRGSVVEMGAIVEAIEAAEPSAHGLITFDPTPLPFPEDMDDAPLRQVFGVLPETPLAYGVGSTIAAFKTALHDGRMGLP
jgi:UDP-glucuronate 4-epimerase